MRFFNLTPERTKIIIAFWVSILILVGLGVYTNIKTISFKKKVENVNRSSVVISRAQEVSTALNYVESSYDKFLLSGDSSFLNTVSINKRILSLRINDLKKTGMDTRQVAIFDSVLKFYDLRFATSENPPNAQYLNSKIKYFITVFLNNQKSTQDKLFEEQNKIFRDLIWVITFSVLISILLLSVTTAYILRVYKRLIRAKSLLQASQIRLENILEELPTGVMIVNVSNKSYHLNKKASELLQQTPVDGSIESYNSLLLRQLLITDAYQGKKSIGVDSSLLINDNQVLLKVSSIPLYNDETLQYCISVFEDVTGIKKAEQELITAKKMTEDTLKLKEAFLENMSHEIRTPMNAILGFTDILSKGNLGKIENEYVAIIKSAGKNLLHIINDILDFSKLNANMMIFEERVTKLNNDVNSVVNLFLPKAKEKNIVLSYKHDENIPEKIMTDPVRLVQVITNIVGNAMKFTEKGSISIVSSVIAETADHITIQFDIEDTGIGISKDKLKKVFTRFEQEAGSRKYGGSGLGLSIAKHIVESLGGKISVRSVVGEGSVFSFYMPFKKYHGQKKKHVIRVYDEVLKTERINILLIEDNHFNIKLIHEIFSKYNVQLDSVENGAAGIQKLINQQYDIILLDIELPDITGYEVAKTVRKQNISTPILALTAHAFAGEEEKCIAVGIDDYLSKPINTDLLFRKITQLTKTHISAKDVSPEVESKSSNLTSMDYISQISGNNREFEEEILDDFLTQTSSRLTILEDAIKNDNHEVIKSNLHHLKSLVSTVFREDLFPKIEVLEKGASNGEISAGWTGQYRELISTIESGMDEIREILVKDYARQEKI